MPLFGSHLSIAGGLYKAAEAAAELGFNTVQIFTGSPNIWLVPPDPLPGALRENKPLPAAEIEHFRTRVRELGLVQPVAHTSYLINLASPDDALWRRSIHALAVDLRRAGALGLIGVVVHPGSAMASSAEEGMVRIARGIDETLALAGPGAAPLLLENTAGQGASLGWSFAQLGQIIAQAARGEELGLCIDTCHAFAAGYDLRTEAGYHAAWEELDREVGLSRVQAIHLNDSKKELGSRVDRHEHIGHGHLGLEPFRLLVNDPRFAAVPMYLETAKEDCDGEPWDAINLRTLKGLLGQSQTPPPAAPAATAAQKSVKKAARPAAQPARAPRKKSPGGKSPRQRRAR